MEVNEKQIAVIEKKIAPLAVTAAQIIIETPEQMRSASEMLTTLNKYGDELEALKKTLTEPMNKALKAARAMFKPREDRITVAVAHLRNAMGTYQLEAEKKAQKEEEKLANRVEKGTMKPETAVKKMGEIDAPVANIETAGGSVKFRTDYELVIESETALLGAIFAGKHQELITINESAVKDYLKRGNTIAGAVLKEKRVVVNSR